MNKVLSRKVLAKLITSPAAVCFSEKKNRNVKEPIVINSTQYDLLFSCDLTSIR
jgi:hypothetical protein